MAKYLEIFINLVKLSIIMKKILAGLIFVFLVLTVGCIGENTNAVAQYENLSAKASQAQNLRLGYTLERGTYSLDVNTANTTLVYNIEADKLDYLEKLVSSLNGSIPFIRTDFERGGMNFVCGGERGCEVGISTTYSAIWTTLNINLSDRSKFSVTINGDKTYAGRTCTDFIGIMLPAYFYYASNYTGNFSGNFEICLDKEFGFPVHYIINESSNISFMGGRGKMVSHLNNINVLTLKSFATDVKPEEMVPPVPFGLFPSHCGNMTNIVVTPFIDSPGLIAMLNITWYNLTESQYPLAVLFNNYGTGKNKVYEQLQLNNLEFGKNQTISKEMPNASSGLYITRLCSGVKCAQTDCFIS